MQIIRSLSPRSDVRRIAVLTVGSLLSFQTPSGIVSYDMASEDEIAEKNFLKLFRKEERRLNKSSTPFSPDRSQADIINKADTKTKADNALRQVGHAVDGHIIEGSKFRPARAPAFVPYPRIKPKQRKRA